MHIVLLGITHTIPAVLVDQKYCHRPHNMPSVSLLVPRLALLLHCNLPVLPRKLRKPLLRRSSTLLFLLRRLSIPLLLLLRPGILLLPLLRLPNIL